MASTAFTAAFVTYLLISTGAATREVMSNQHVLRGDRIARRLELLPVTRGRFLGEVVLIARPLSLHCLSRTVRTDAGGLEDRDTTIQPQGSQGELDTTRPRQGQARLCHRMRVSLTLASEFRSGEHPESRCFSARICRQTPLNFGMGIICS